MLRVRALAFVPLVALAAAAPAPALDPAAAAATAAAAGALELERTADARIWLERVPVADRGWVWRHLAATASGEDAVLLRHPAPLTALAVRPDGARLAVGGADGALLWIAAANGTAPPPLAEAHAGGVTALAWSADGRRLASLGADRAARVWDAETGEPLAAWTIDAARVAQLVWEPGGGALAVGGFRWQTGDDGRRRPQGVVWRFAADGSPRGELVASSISVTALAVAPDGARLAAGGPQGRLDEFTLASGERQSVDVDSARGFPQFHALAYAADGARLWGAAGNGFVYSFQSATLALTTQQPPAGPLGGALTALALAPDGLRVAMAGSDLAARVRSLAGGDETALLGHTGAVTAVAWLPTGRLVTASDDGTLRRWDPDRGKPLVHPHSVWDVAFSPDGELVATAGEDGTLRLWSTARRELVRAIAAHDGDAVGVVFSADGGELVSSGNDGRLRIWRVASGELAAELEAIDDGRAVALAISPDGHTLAAGSSRGAVQLWDLPSRRLVATLRAHQGEVYDAVFTPDGATLVTESGGGEVVVWDVAAATDRRRWTAHPDEIRAVALSPDGTLLATASDDHRVRLWRLATGEPAGELALHGARVWDVAWSPDGATLATASNDFTARLWDAASGLPLAVRRYPIEVYRVRFSADGQTLAVAPFDGRVELLAAR